MMESRGHMKYDYFIDELDYLRYLSPTQLEEMWEACRPKIEGVEGRIIITGTCGEMNKEDYKLLWYNEENTSKENK